MFRFCILCFLFLALLAACGRRGDPVALSPYNGRAPHKNVVGNNDNGKKDVIKENKTEAEKMKVLTPGRPTGLTGLYMQKSIVLIWDEIIGQDVRLYRIYRSLGGEYILAGDTVTPAFTDNNIEKNKKYYYRVTAVAAFESLPSKEIEILTDKP